MTLILKKEYGKTVYKTKKKEFAHLMKEPYTTNLDYKKIYEK